MAQVQWVHILRFSGANVVTGATSGATGTPDANADSAVTLANSNTITFTDGYANPELATRQWEYYLQRKQSTYLPCNRPDGRH